MLHTYVTGGCGFVGSHLVERLLAYGHFVTILDNLSRGKNFPMLKTGYRLCMADLAERCPDFEPDSVVFHLAAKVTGIEYNRFHHYDMQMTNEAINHNVFEAVRRSRPKLFVYTSTACVYPPDAPVPTPESAAVYGNPEPTNWGYGIAKWSGEQAVKALCLEYGIPCIIVRPSNMCGLRDHYDEESSHVIPALIKRVLDGENPVVVWGSGNQTRSFLNASDAARAFVELMYFGCINGAPEAIIVNIGHSREVSIRDLAELIVGVCVEEGLETTPRIVYDISKPDGYPRRAADTTWLKHLIGWVPDKPLKDTVREMVLEYKERFKRV